LVGRRCGQGPGSAELQSTITGAIEEQTATTSEISYSLAEAAQGGGEIADGIAVVANAAGETSTGAAAVEEAARNLTRLAEELNPESHRE